MSDVQFDEQFSIDKDLPRSKEPQSIMNTLRVVGFSSGTIYSDCAYGALSIILFAAAFSLFFSTTMKAFGGEEKMEPQINQESYVYQE